MCEYVDLPEGMNFQLIFFLNHKNALNKSVLICARLTFNFILSKKSVGLGSGRGKLSCALAYKELKLF